MTALKGEWRLVNGGSEPVGTERWTLDEGSEDFRWNSVIDKTVPYPYKEEVNVEGIARKWRISSIRLMSVSSDRENSFEGKVENDTFRVLVKRSKINEECSLPVSASTE